jgi:hypothetical protein
MIVSEVKVVSKKDRKGAKPPLGLCPPGALGVQEGYPYFLVDRVDRVDTRGYL